MDPDEKDSEGKAFAARTVFVVGPEKQLKLALLYPSSTGRNFGEASGVALGVGWGGAGARRIELRMNDGLPRGGEGHEEPPTGELPRPARQGNTRRHRHWLPRPVPPPSASPPLASPASLPPHTPGVQLLRVIDSLQLAAKFPVATPADWKQVGTAA